MSKKISTWGFALAMTGLFSAVRYSAERDVANPNYLIIRDNTGRKVRVQIPDDVSTSDRYSIKLNKEILERLFPDSSQGKDVPKEKMGQVAELESKSGAPVVVQSPPKGGDNSSIAPVMKSGDQNSLAPLGGGGGGGGAAQGDGGSGLGQGGAGTGSGSGSGSGTAMGGSGGSCSVGPVQPTIDVSLSSAKQEGTEPVEDSVEDRKTKMWLEDEIRKLSREMQRMSDMQNLQNSIRSVQPPTSSGANSQAGTSAESLMFLRLGEIQEKLKNMEIQKEVQQQEKLWGLQKELDLNRKDKVQDQQEALTKEKNQQYIQALQEIRNSLKELRKKPDKPVSPPESPQNPLRTPPTKTDEPPKSSSELLTPYSYKKWNQDMPDVSRRVLRANTLYHGGKYLEAMDELNRAEAINPYDARVKMMKGSLFYKLGWIDYAVKFWEKSLLIDPTQRYLYSYIENAKREQSATTESPNKDSALLQGISK